MEVVDDMKLGKLVKESGLRSGVAKAGDAVSVHWHAGLGNTIRGTTKNFFAAAGFKLWLVSAQILGIAADVRVSGGRSAICPRVGPPVRSDRGGVPLIMAGGVASYSSVAPLRPHLPDRRPDFRLDARAFHNRHPVAGRNHLARHLLPAGGIKARAWFSS